MKAYNEERQNKSKKGTILVLAPHQDDEIDLAAYTLLNLKDWDKYILYSTNGDNRTPAVIRYREAIKSAEVLGVSKENVIFLGYGDNNDASTCPFFSDNKSVVSASGHTETYGADRIRDYHYIKHGMHSPYTYKAFKEDLKEAVLEIGADLIICVDFDSHIDHRMLSIAFDEVMKEILSKSSNSYFPEIWKRFGYAMSYFAPEDYLPYNNKENVFPPVSSLKTGEYRLIGKSLYQWDARIRVPAIGNNGRFIRSHRIVKALKCHVSQYSLFRAFRMDNGDEVFWRKRTDNLAMKAGVSVSDGDASKLNDFKYYDTKDIDKVSCKFDNDSWLPVGEKPTVTFSWSTSVEVGRLVIFGSVLGNGYKGRIELLTDCDDLFQEIQVSDKPWEFDFLPHIYTRTLEIVFLDGFSNRNGIAEIEVYENEDYLGCLDELLICSSGNVSKDKSINNSMILIIDKCWMKIMRIISYYINYSSLVKYKGLSAAVSKVCNRLGF